MTVSTCRCETVAWEQVGDVMRRIRGQGILVLPVLALALVSLTPASHADPAGTRYRSPVDVAFSPDGSGLAAADPTWGGVVIIDPQNGTVLRELPLQGDPSHVIWNGNDNILVSEGQTGTVAEVSATSGAILRRMPVVSRAAGLAITSDSRLMLVCDRGLNRVALVDLSTGDIAQTVDVAREPEYIVLTGDDQYAVVGNKLPRSGDARLADYAAEVSVIEVSTGRVRNVRLPGGCSIIRQIAISPDGQWAYVIHQINRSNSTLTSLERGWGVVNGVSIIDIAAASLYTTFLFDKDGWGAANPWGIAVSPDGSKLWATLAGSSELAVVDLQALHAQLASDQDTRTYLYINLGFMFEHQLLARRVVSDVEGIRGLALNPAGTQLAVAAYFEGRVLLIDLAGDYWPSDESQPVRTKAVVLDNNPPEDQTRRGERFFNSGRSCLGQWLSCATCHDSGRMDGLNRDLLNDGPGNPRNTRSLVLSAVTPPVSITGCETDALAATRDRYKNVEFVPASEERISATYAYLQSVTPEPSPYLGPDGKLTSIGLAGKKIFENAEVGCSRCHGSPLFTDLRRHDVGTRVAQTDIGRWDDEGYDTPTLVELWRTAPYLHLGHAATLKDVLTTYNQDDKHGKTSHLSPEQLDQLIEYLRQIGPSQDETGQVDSGTERLGPDAATGIPPRLARHGACYCRAHAPDGDTTRSSALQTIAFGTIMLILSVWRRRRGA